MRERIPSAGILLYEGSKVLLVEHTENAGLPTGSYGFPAGRIEDREMPVETAARELYEETGLITCPRFLYKIKEKENTIMFKNGWYDGTIQIFFCDDYFGELRASEETIPKFVEVRKVGDLYLVSDDVIEITRKYLGYKPTGRG